MDRIAKMKHNFLINEGASFSPYDCLLYLTIKCNLNCPMCFQQNHEKRTKDITLEDIQSIFERTPVDSVFLIGGEIFVRKDIYDILDYFDTSGKKISFLSNGTLINREGIEKIKKYKNLHEVWFSLDGLKSVNDKIRGKGSFEKVSKVIKELTPFKTVNVNCVILEENIDQLEEILDYVNSLGVSKISFQFKMCYTVEQYIETMHLTQKELGFKNLFYDDCVKTNIDLSFMNKLKEIAPRLNKTNLQTKVTFYPTLFLKQLDQYINGTLRTNNKLICNDFVNARLKIGSKGELLLCESMKFSPGNLLDKDLDSLWNNDEMRIWRKQLCNINMTEMCSRCCGVGVIS
ncbi:MULTISPECIES: radical SAM protein [unclassified Sutcliffiella]|uniref:radical SAM protein n=1 Tax=unclassified Sutcliffiella TaxID=2837532 RepID=UPI0030CD4DA6